MKNKIINNCERYLHHLNFAFTLVVFAALIFYVILNLFNGNFGIIETIFFLMGILGLSMWTFMLGKLSMQEEAKHKAQLRGDTDEK